MTDTDSPVSVCPYEDKHCPKISDIAEDVESNETRLCKIERMLYILVGMIAINSGLLIWR